MSCEKKPVSLRTSFFRTSLDEPRVARVGLIALGCFALAGASTSVSKSASAQTAGELPALSVEAARERAPKPRKKPAPTRDASAQAPASAAAAASGSGAPAAGSIPAASANPYADPAAPYKVDRSASGKLTQPLLDTPRTVTTTPKEVIADKGATSFRELIRTMPGLTLGTGEGGNAFGDRVFIRGFDARNDMYVDGVRDSGVNVRETFNTEQVEIVKGPSGSIGGRGTAGGAVNVVTKKPLFVDFHEATVTFGTDATRRIAFDVNRVVTPDIAIRANGMVQKGDVAGRDYLHDDRWGGALGLTWKPSQQLTFTLDYFHVDMNQTPDWGVPFDVRIKQPFTESGLRRNNFYGIENRDFQRGKQDVLTSTTDWKISDWLVFTNKLRYSDSTLDYVAGAPGAPITTNADPALWTVNSTAKSRYQTTQTLANQSDLTAKIPLFGALHTIVAGVEAGHEKTWRDSYRALDTETNVIGSIPGMSLNLWSPNSGAIAWTDSLTLAGLPTSVEILSRSAYLLDTINFSEKLFITGGVRVDHYDISANAVGASATTSLSRQDLMTNWNLGATYKLLPNWALYAAYGTSSNPVGSEIDGNGSDYGGLSVQNAGVGPERNTAVEVGTKVELFERRLLATFSLFQTTKDNARETVGSGASATVVGGGEYAVRGAEFGLGGKIGERWSLFGGAVFLDSEVLQSTNAANVGKRLANLAHASFNLLAKYDVTDQLTLGGQATFKSRIFGGTMAANENTLPESWRFDAFAEYRFTKSISGKLMVQNIANEVIYDTFYRSSAPYVYVAPGRVASVSLNFKY